MRLYFSGSDHVNSTVQLAATPQLCGHVLALWSLAPRRVRLPGSRDHRSLANPLCPSRF
jgi:hypothetical protein